MSAGIQQAEKQWHEALYSSRELDSLWVSQVIRDRYLDPPAKPRFPLEMLFRRIGDVRGKRVLIFGCGDDNATVLLALKGAEVWAFDLSETAVRRQEIMARVNDVAGRVHLVVCAGEEFPFADGVFDIVVGAAILHHIPDHIPYLPSQLRRVLRDGGRAWFVEPVIRSRVMGRVLDLLPGHQEISPGERQLTDNDLAHFSRLFQVQPWYFCFLSRLDRFFLKGPLETATSARRSLIHVIHWLDDKLFHIPFADRLAGVVVLELQSK